MSSASSLSKKISGFFQDLEIYREALDKKSKEKTGIDFQAIESFFHSLKPALYEYMASGKSINFWQEAYVGSDELKNCKIMSWFLDRNGSHGLGDFLLYEIIAYLHSKNNIAEATFPRPEKIKLGNYRTGLEVVPNGDAKNRVDIQLDGDKFLLYFEVKINAGETGDQLDRYINLASKLSSGRDWGVIYLTIDGRKPKELKDHGRISLQSGNLVTMRWSEVASVIEDNCHKVPEGLTNSLLVQYAKFIRAF